MHVTDVLAGLAAATLAASGAIVLVVLASRPLRRACGARCAYLLWGAVPLAMLATWLPARVVQVAPAEAAAAATRILDATGQAGAVLAQASGPDIAAWGLVIWACGVVLMTARCLQGHRQFLAGLGTVRARRDGLYQADAVEGLPAVVGLGARIVLPADFRTRFARDERALVLAHERVHVARGDVWWNLLAATLWVLQWFNPLAWWALHRFRIDQELACDAAVLARAGRHRRSYGQALLKTQMPARPALLACQWPGAHPLKERIEMLAHTAPHRIARRLGTGLVVASSLAFATVVWAAQPPTTEIPTLTPPAAESGEVTVTYAADAGTVDIDGANVPVGDLLRRLATATGRTLDVAQGVDLSMPVTMRFRSVPLADAETLIDSELDEARLQLDERVIRVIPAPGKRGGPDPSPGR